ncbi:hypothetical protein BayCH28_08280 [Mycolicibacterium sp. CH28]|uniref:hypothetical protein n=1 Tax=Mycolicibacterium sp. CH28 TaxID=2512237 RepID=UPI001080220A|nr:hypothetical protein [Mycolicibacterium sp. CH28]TGD89327.1 hypothetical protein BayCH28_08280 [Mycolicibacterium sp. CH28]
MSVVLRSRVTAGIAAIGASAIVLSPISVTPPDLQVPAIHMSTLATALTGASQTLPTWAQVIETSFSNIATLGQQVQSSPDPIIQQIITNQLANAATISTALGGAFGGLVAGVTSLPQTFLTATQQLAAGQFSAAVQTLFQGALGLVLAPVISLLPVFDIPGQIATNFAKVLTAVPNILLPVGLSAISPIAGAVYAFGDTGQLVVDSLKAGDATAAIRALVSMPAAVTGAFLNGYPAQFTTGILSPYSGSAFGSGLIASLLAARDTIAQALGAPVPPTAAAVAARSVAPSAGAATPVKESAPAESSTSSAPSTGASLKRAVTTDSNKDGNKAVPATTASPAAAAGTGSETGSGSGSTAGGQRGDGAKKGLGGSGRNAGNSAKAGAHSGAE